ncbi:hypothetical protein FOZ61_008860, partial [Perkinsus olseni]
MALRLIISVYLVAVLAYGCGKGGTTKPTRCPTTVRPRGIKKSSDEFVYERFFFRIVLLADHDTGLGMFSMECGDATPYQTDWFDLHPNIDDPASIHVVPESGPGRDAHDAWLAGVRGACPSAEFPESDLESFVVDAD